MHLVENKVHLKGALKLSANGMEIPAMLDLNIESKNSVQP
jgi:hypothetical protein